ncbi:hypothetical protein, partial [Candidatus Burkholderia verschuerenii]|uniref:hypothetical protein n=1 Tax=Candidatus Burkholderia verschuerenii TaxID=242163 RepID=UPI0012ED7F53
MNIVNSRFVRVLESFFYFYVFLLTLCFNFSRFLDQIEDPIQQAMRPMFFGDYFQPECEQQFIEESWGNQEQGYQCYQGNSNHMGEDNYQASFQQQEMEQVIMQMLLEMREENRTRGQKLDLQLEEQGRLILELQEQLDAQPQDSLPSDMGLNPEGEEQSGEAIAMNSDKLEVEESNQIMEETPKEMGKRPMDSACCLRLDPTVQEEEKPRSEEKAQVEESPLAARSRNEEHDQDLMSQLCEMIETCFKDDLIFQLMEFGMDDEEMQPACASSEEIGKAEGSSLTTQPMEDNEDHEFFEQLMLEETEVNNGREDASNSKEVFK